MLSCALTHDLVKEEYPVNDLLNRAVVAKSCCRTQPENLSKLGEGMIAALNKKYRNGKNN